MFPSAIEESEDELDEFAPIADGKLRIEGDWNFEIPEILHTMFLFLDAREIIRLCRVSKTFREVGTSDLLWSYILKNRREYLGSDLHVSKFTFFYDIDRRKEDVFDAVSKKFRRAYHRKKKLKKKEEKRRREEKVKETLDRLWISTENEGILAFVFIILIGCTLILAPPLGILVLILLGLIKYKYNNHDDGGMNVLGYIVLYAGFLVDSFFALCCSLGGLGCSCCCLQYCLSCCFCCGICCVPGCLVSVPYSLFCQCITVQTHAVLEFFPLAGRVFFFEKDEVDSLFWMSPGSLGVIGALIPSIILIYQCGWDHLLD